MTQSKLYLVIIYEKKFYVAGENLSDIIKKFINNYISLGIYEEDNCLYHIYKGYSNLDNTKEKILILREVLDLDIKILKLITKLKKKEKLNNDIILEIKNNGKIIKHKIKSNKLIDIFDSELDN